MMATRLPGPGSRVLRHELDYVGPVSIGDRITVELEVLEKLDGHRIVLACRCLGTDGNPVVQGQVLVEVPEHTVTEPVDAVTALESGGRRQQLRRLLDQARSIPLLRTAVVQPVDAPSLGGAMAAAGHGLIVPLLVGPEHRIRETAKADNIDLEGVEIVATEHIHAAAVALVAEGRADALMKGALHTDEFMSAVIARESGLRTARRMSHAWVMDVPTYPRPLIITDSALNIRPDLMTKADIVCNAIELAHAMDVERPRVAILSATEEVNPRSSQRWMPPPFARWRIGGRFAAVNWMVRWVLTLPSPRRR